MFFYTLSKFLLSVYVYLEYTNLFKKRKGEYKMLTASFMNISFKGDTKYSSNKNEKEYYYNDVSNKKEYYYEKEDYYNDVSNKKEYYYKKEPVNSSWEDEWNRKAKKAEAYKQSAGSRSSGPSSENYRAYYTVSRPEKPDPFKTLDRKGARELLGVSLDSDKKTIKRAYFDFMKFVHPDKTDLTPEQERTVQSLCEKYGLENKDELCKLINKAYEMLS